MEMKGKTNETSAARWISVEGETVERERPFEESVMCHCALFYLETFLHEFGIFLF